jgi:protein SCO1
MHPHVETPTLSCGCGAASEAPLASPVSGAFELVDHFGHQVNERSFGDRYLLVFFGFTHCKLVCPRELTKLGRALELLGPAALRVQPLYVSVDPARDDPRAMQRYLSQYDGGFIGLTGSADQVEAAKTAYRVFANPVTDDSAPGGYVVPHTALAYFMAPGGRYKAHFMQSLDAEAVARLIGRHLA